MSDIGNLARGYHENRGQRGAFRCPLWVNRAKAVRVLQRRMSGAPRKRQLATKVRPVVTGPIASFCSAERQRAFPASPTMKNVTDLPIEA
jgi:hypothetical protein